MSKLNLGCAKDIKDGYVNVDLFDHPLVTKCDVRKLAFASDESVDEVFAKDILEHLHFAEIDAVLREWNRVLKRGGKLFIQTIDIESQIRAFQSGIWSLPDLNYMLFAGVSWTGSPPIPEDFHKSAHSVPFLTAKLKEHGFAVTSVDTDKIGGELKNYPRAHNLNMKIWAEKL